MHIRGGHLHPGEVGWRRLEAKGGVKNGFRIIFSLHWIIFSSVGVLVEFEMTESVDFAWSAGSRGTIRRAFPVIRLGASYLHLARFYFSFGLSRSTLHIY